MIRARDLIGPGRYLLRKEGSATYHKFNGCFYATRQESGMDAVQATAAILDMIESAFGPAKLCISCFGTDGRKTAAQASQEPSPKVTLDTRAQRADDGIAITPDHPRKDHEMAQRTTLSKTMETPSQARDLHGTLTELADAAQGVLDGSQSVTDGAGSGDQVDDWSLDSLADSIEHRPYQSAPQASFDAIAGTPEIIRRKAEVSLGHNAAAARKAAASGAKRPRIDYRWDLQPVPDAAKGEMFVKALEKYATNRPANVTIPHRQEGTPDGRVTARCGAPTQFRKTAATYVERKEGDEGEWFWAVRYSVRPFEQRGAGRKPNAAK